MERLACVNVAALPLQLLLRAHPDWRSQPVAVVEDDRPQALVLSVNARARRAGVRTGQRYTTALAIERHLRAGVVSRSQIDEGIRTLTDCLRCHAPRVEPSRETPGLFWLDVGGFTRLHPSLRAWAGMVRRDLERLEMWSSIAVGFSRFGVYALAIAHHRVVVSSSADEEAAAVRQVPLGRLGLDPDARDRLQALGIGTVGDFLRLPGDGVGMRFGAAAGALHQLATGQRVSPLVPLPAEPVHERTIDFDAPESNVERLIFVVKGLLDGSTIALAHQALAVSALTLHLKLDDRTTRTERMRPAAPTLDVAQLLTLIRLRLESLQLSSGIVTLRIVADVCPATADQCRLFAEQVRRDTVAANQALARLRAECGEHCVVRACLRDAHLPAARFVWEPICVSPSERRHAASPHVRSCGASTCVLDFWSRIANFHTPAASEDDETGTRHREHRAVSGFYVLSGGWWMDSEGKSLRRDYGFVRTATGDLWWVYYDKRQRLFLQGCVE
ncbi:MAG: DNA polymerase Y family protein [Vicinamibacterales bacterium]